MVGGTTEPERSIRRARSKECGARTRVQPLAAWRRATSDSIGRPPRGARDGAEPTSGMNDLDFHALASRLHERRSPPSADAIASPRSAAIRESNWSSSRGETPYRTTRQSTGEEPADVVSRSGGEHERDSARGSRSRIGTRSTAFQFLELGSALPKANVWRGPDARKSAHAKHAKRRAGAAPTRVARACGTRRFEDGVADRKRRAGIGGRASSAARSYRLSSASSASCPAPTAASW